MAGVGHRQRGRAGHLASATLDEPAAAITKVKAVTEGHLG